MIKMLFTRLFSLRHPVWAERPFVSLLIFAAVVFMAISLTVGLVQSVWFDEAYSIMLARQPVTQLIHLTAMDTHPPLYYLLLKGWAGLFGWSEPALRGLSVLAAGGAVVLAGFFVRRLFGVRTAVVTLPFIVFAPFLLRYGFEIRMYALASLIGIAATYVLTVALDAAGRRRIVMFAVYAVLVALGVYTLYYTVLLWLTHFAWLLWMSRRKKQPVLKSAWLMAFVGAIVLFLPWLPTFASQIGNGALAPISQAMTLDNLLGIITFGFVYQPVWQLSPLVSLLVFAVLLVLGYFGVQGFKKVERGQRPYLVLLAMYVLGPVVILTIVSLARPMYVERYLAHVLIGMMMFIGVVVAIVTKKSSVVTRGFATLLFVTLLVGVAQLAEVGNYNFQRLQKPAIDQVAAEVKTCDGNDAILAADPYVATELAYYLADCTVNFYSDTASLGGGYAAFSGSPLRIGDPAVQLASKQKIHYVYYDRPTLTMPAGFTETTHRTAGALTVATFSVE